MKTSSKSYFDAGGILQELLRLCWTVGFVSDATNDDWPVSIAGADKGVLASWVCNKEMQRGVQVREGTGAEAGCVHKRLPELFAKLRCLPKPHN